MRTWIGLVIVALVALVAARRAPLGASERAGPATLFRAPETGRYHRTDEVRLLLEDWAAADPERVRARALEPGEGAPAVPTLEVGVGAPDRRSPGGAHGITVLLIGGADGRSVAGCEAVLHAMHALLGALDRLPGPVRVVAIPRVAPAALDRVLDAARPAGGMPGPVDRDGDGAAGEDPGDDLDGDGLILDMIVEDAAGPWCLASDGRTLLPAVDGEAPRFRRSLEGRDDDGDGRHNEDCGRGIRWDVHFPVGWPGPGPSAGLRPVSDPTARAVARHVAELRPSLALVFEGNHGGIRVHARPDAHASDRALHRRLASAFARSTGRPDAAGPDPFDPVDGDLGDWLAGALGVPTVEVAVWGPRAVGLDGRPLGPEPPGASADEAALPAGPFEAARRAPAEARAWGRWLDEVRGGAGFVDWHPVDLGGGRTGLVGGWEPLTRFNPPEELLASALAGTGRFVDELVAALPRLEIEVVEAERDGDLVRLAARVVNRGALSTGVLGSLEGGEPLTLSVGSNCDAALLAGAPEMRLDGGLLAREASATRTWLFQVEPGATLVLEASGPCGMRATREVRR